MFEIFVQRPSVFLAWNLGSILCFISWTFFLFDCNKIYLLIMLQVVYKGTFLFGHLNNANKQLIYVWSHAVLVSGDTVHGGTACRGANLGYLHILSFCCWKFKSWGLLPHIVQVYLYKVPACIICIVLVLIKWWQDLGLGYGW